MHDRPQHRLFLDAACPAALAAHVSAAVAKLHADAVSLCC
jgi:hypothetical protein